MCPKIKLCECPYFKHENKEREMRATAGSLFIMHSL
jgi:hypothetical protein